MTTHFFTVDVEEHFQVSAFENVVSRADWTRLPGRLDRNVPILLEELSRFDAKGTFFVLGWVAKHRAHVVREIAGAGHEVASHGFWHERVNTLSSERFREDVRAAKATLEDLLGAPVLGYRAPSFSITPGFEWAFDVLLEEGYRYDSSIFPINHDRYGIVSAPRLPFEIELPNGTVWRNLTTPAKSKVAETLDAWKARVDPHKQRNWPPRMWEVMNRQALLDYDKNPQQSLPSKEKRNL